MMQHEYAGLFEGEYWDQQKLEEDIVRSQNEPRFDFFSENHPNRPKLTVGQYVKSKGIPVPLAEDQDTWEAAFDSDRAMLRSEMRQDYSGFSGLLSSEILQKERLQYPLEYGDSSPEIRQKLGNLLINGLRSRELSAAEYMRHFRWNEKIEGLYKHANRLGVRSPLDMPPAVSHWQYMPGTNIRVFKDPVVENRYHIGSHPDHGYVLGWSFDVSVPNQAIQHEPDDLPVPVDGIIEMYESIRSLPLFDTSQCPVIELVYDRNGEFHFLQYLKTGLEEAIADPFDLPEDNAAVRANNVRGATSPEGEDIRIYITPRRITRRMIGQGFYFDLIYPNSFAQQYMSMVGRVVIQGAYIGMKNNHFNSAPLYRPKVAMGLMGGRNMEPARKLRELVEEVHPPAFSRPRTNPRHVYIKARITSNGHEATIESDWKPRYERDDALEF